MNKKEDEKKQIEKYYEIMNESQTASVIKWKSSIIDGGFDINNLRKENIYSISILTPQRDTE